MIIPSGRACMHTADLQTRCGPQAHQWHGYFLMGFEAWCITQKKKNIKTHQKTMAVKVPGPSGELTSVKCTNALQIFMLISTGKCCSLSFYQRSFFLQPTVADEGTQMGKFENWWLGEEFEILHSEQTQPLHSRTHNIYSEIGEGLMAYPSWGFISQEREVLIFNSVATGIPVYPLCSRV